jgi:hypothetical protein
VPGGLIGLILTGISCVHTVYQRRKVAKNCEILMPLRCPHTASPSDCQVRRRKWLADGRLAVQRGTSLILCSLTYFILVLLVSTLTPPPSSSSISLLALLRKPFFPHSATQGSAPYSVTLTTGRLSSSWRTLSLSPLLLLS